MLRNIGLRPLKHNENLFRTAKLLKLLYLAFMFGGILTNLQLQAQNRGFVNMALNIKLRYKSLDNLVVLIKFSLCFMGLKPISRKIASKIPYVSFPIQLFFFLFKNKINYKTHWEIFYQEHIKSYESLTYE